MLLRRIFSYPLVILAILVGLIAGTSATANALTGYPTNFTVNAGSVINDGGQNVMQLNAVNPTNSASSDYYINSLGSWGGSTVWVCITAKPSNNNQTHVSASWGASGGFQWLVFNGSAYTRNCFATYNNVGGWTAAAYRVRVYVITSQARVRSVEIFPY